MLLVPFFIGFWLNNQKNKNKIFKTPFVFVFFFFFGCCCCFFFLGICLKPRCVCQSGQKPDFFHFLFYLLLMPYFTIFPYLVYLLWWYICCLVCFLLYHMCNKSKIPKISYFFPFLYQTLIHSISPLSFTL